MYKIGVYIRSRRVYNIIRMMDMVAADMIVADMGATMRKNDRMKLIDVDFITLQEIVQ